MAQSDWTDLSSSVSTADLARGVTAGMTPPNSSVPNAFVYGYNVLDGTVIGAHGKFADLSDFNPTGSGPAVADGSGSVRGCVKRVPGPASEGFTPFLFGCAQGTPPSVNDFAYLLGLLDADPYEIVLAKGTIIGGILDDEEGIEILARSSAQYNIGDDLWHHLRMDCLVEPNGDVLIKCYSNDLVGHPIGAASTWVNIPGFDASGFVDDRLQINSGSAPLLGGCWGWAFAFSEALGRRGAFDALEVYRGA